MRPAQNQAGAGQKETRNPQNHPPPVGVSGSKTVLLPKRHREVRRLFQHSWNWQPDWKPCFEQVLRFA